MDDEDVWKQRFYSFMGARLLGLALLILGVAIGFSDLVREGGSREVGVVIVIIGAIVALFVPRLLKKQWERE